MGNMGVMICLGQGGLCSLSASSGRSFKRCVCYKFGVFVPNLPIIIAGILRSFYAVIYADRYVMRPRNNCN